MAMEQQQQQQQHAFQSRQLLSSSQENLLASFGGGVGGGDGQGNNGGNDSAESLRHIYVALYDFNSGGENQLTIRKGNEKTAAAFFAGFSAPLSILQWESSLRERWKYDFFHLVGTVGIGASERASDVQQQ